MWNLINRSSRLIKLLSGFRYLSSCTDPQQQLRARQAIAQQFADARGVTMKVGQLMAVASDVEDAFAPLITSIEPLPLAQVIPLIEASLGCRWKIVFQSIDESNAAASLGQVHHAVLKDGREVAIKVQYPQIDTAIDAEMKLLGIMPKAGPVKKWNVDLDGYRQLLKQNMTRELDYRHEAETQQLFYRELELPAVVVPYVYTELSSEKMLVQSWESGDFLQQAASWPQKQREQIARTLLSILLTSLFKTRRLHADPHMGNSYFRYRDDTSGEIEMVLMDFGCSIELEEQQSMALLKLILSRREKTPGMPISNFVAMGFDSEKLARIEAYLPRLCLYLFQPFLDDDVFQLRNWHPGKQITELLGEKRWWFRSAGPAQLIFIMRAFQGLVQQLQLLNVDINWWQVMKEVLPDSLFEAARDYPLLDVHGGRDTEVAALANSLKVRITRHDGKKTEVNLPAEAVLELQSFIPDEIKLKLAQAEDINLPQIVERVRDSGIATQTVFDYKDENKHYQVWLE